MMGKLLPSRTGTRPERPTFKPFLEALESREVPTCVQTSAVFHALPTDVSNLMASINARDVNGINTNVNTVAGDVFQLVTGAPGFTVASRLQIDSALVANGLTMVFSGFQNFPFIPIQQFESIVQLGATAAREGFFDFLAAGFFPNTSGDCVLT